MHQHEQTAGLGMHSGVVHATDAPVIGALVVTDQRPAARHFQFVCRHLHGEGMVLAGDEVPGIADPRGRGGEQILERIEQRLTALLEHYRTLLIKAQMKETAVAADRVEVARAGRVD